MVKPIDPDELVERKLAQVGFMLDTLRRVLKCHDDEAVEDAAYRVVAERDHFERQVRRLERTVTKLKEDSQ